MSTDSQLHGKHAIVTGASQGIGQAIASALAAAGVSVCLAGRNTQKLEQLAASLANGAYVRSLDLNDPHSIETLSNEESEVDILVNCGGMYDSGTMSSVAAGSLSKMLRCNVVGPYELTRSLLSGIVARHGQIVFMNSSIVRGGNARTGQFAASAHALKAIANSLRDEVNPLGVRVLSVFPGRTATPRQEQIFAREDRDYRAAELLQADDIADVLVHALQLPVTAELTDLWIRPAKNFAK